MHLSDCFAPVIRYTLRLRQAGQESQQRVEQVRGEILDLLAHGEELARQGGIDSEEYESARFAVCVWIDDLMRTLGDGEGGKDAPGQDRAAGPDGFQEFLQRLQSLPKHQREVREVFYLCLALGFTGRHCANLDQLRGAQLAALNGSASPLLLQDKDLFPGGYPQDLPHAAKDTGRLSLASVAAVAALTAPLLFLALLVLAYRVTLRGVAQSFMQSIPF